MLMMCLVWWVDVWVGEGRKFYMIFIRNSQRKYTLSYCKDCVGIRCPSMMRSSRDYEKVTVCIAYLFDNRAGE